MLSKRFVVTAKNGQRFELITLPKWLHKIVWWVTLGKVSVVRIRYARSNESATEGCLLADGFEEALIGFGTRFNSPVTIYDVAKCVDILIDRDGMSHEEAVEYMDYNVLGAYVGEETPIFLGDYVGS